MFFTYSIIKRKRLTPEEITIHRLKDKRVTLITDYHFARERAENKLCVWLQYQTELYILERVLTESFYKSF